MAAHADSHMCECFCSYKIRVGSHVVPLCVWGAWLRMYVKAVSMADVCVPECCAATFLSITQPLHQEVTVGGQASFNQGKKFHLPLT